MKTKSSYLPRIIKSSTYAKQEKTRKKKITNIKNERGALTAYLTNIWMIKEYEGQFCNHKFKNLDKMKQFFKSWKLQNSLKEKQIIWIDLYLLKKLSNYLKIFNLRKKKTPSPDDFTHNLSKYLRKTH